MRDSTHPTFSQGKLVCLIAYEFARYRQPNEMWITTGMYPQELTISFVQARVVKEVSFLTSGVKKVEIQGCATANGNDFKVIGESKELQGSRG